MMKMILLFLVMACAAGALTLTLKNGEVITGDPIFESKTTLVMKEKSAGTVSVFKKSIAKVDSISLEGKREFMVGDSAMLTAKNELVLRNGSTDSCTVRLRNSPEGKRVREVTLAPGDSVCLPLADGSYFETVRYWRSAGEYFMQGQPFLFNPKPESFQKYEIELKGCIGTTIPTLKGPRIAYERE